MNHSLKRWSVRFGRLLILLFLIAAVLWTISRATYPTAEQREAMAVMESYGPQPGRNAFALVWTLARAVPEGKMRAVVNEDARALRAGPAIPGPEEFGRWNFESAAARYPDLTPSPGDTDMFCSDDAAQCLARVRADLDGYLALIERNRQLLDRVAELPDYGHYRTEFPLYMHTPMPAWSPAVYLSTREAVWYVNGRVDQALAANCRIIDGWRRLGAHSDTLLTRVLSASMAIRRHGALLAEMLAELPPDHALPDICDRALAPPEPEELRLCPAMRGEYRIAANTNDAIAEFGYPERGWFGRIATLIAFDAEATSAMTAENYVTMCSDNELERIAADSPDRETGQSVRVVSFQCLANYVGCAMSGISAPAYTQYRLRMQDFGARLKLLGALADARGRCCDKGRNDPAIAADALDRRLATLSGPHRAFEVAPAGDAIRVELMAPRDGQYWSIPVPAAMAGALQPRDIATGDAESGTRQLR